MTQPGLKEFILELSQYAKQAEDALQKIESDPETNKNLFNDFYERMFAIRGTAQQLQLPNIAEIAGLGEEIAFKARNVTQKAQLRKCVSCLWDALTTTKYVLEHYNEKTQEEQQILINRLQHMLKVLGGAQPKASQDQIEELLRKNS